MSDFALITYGLPLLGGAILGSIFFGGLWWTVRSLATSRRPGLLFTASLAIRTIIVLAGFYLLGRDRWQNYLALLIGVLAARIVLTRLLRAPPRSTQADTVSSSPSEDIAHAADV